MSPLFSIITVTRNCKQALDTTLRSVKSQTCDLYEQIIIDSASTDGTAELARGCGIENLIVVSEPDHGIYDAMNKGLSRAQGDYLIFLNAGDTFSAPETLQLIADKAFECDYPGIIYGQTRIVDEQTRQVLAPRHLNAPVELTIDSFAEGMVVCHQAFVALRKLASNFDTRYRYSADYDWCIKILHRSKRNAYLDATIIDFAASGATTAHRRASLMERYKIMAHYYGTWRAVKNHLRFIPRFIKRNKLEKQWQ